MKLLYSTILTGFVVCAAVSVRAEIEVTRSVTGCGGGEVFSGRYTIRATLGQAIIGEATADRGRIPFWVACPRLRGHESTASKPMATQAWP